MKRTEIQRVTPFKDLFVVKDELLMRIVTDMRQHGFDQNKPLIIWENNGTGHPILIDGHTRMTAAELLNIHEVPVVEKKFNNEQEAMSYAITCQRNRRNLTEAEIVNCVASVDKKRKQGGDHGNQYTGGKEASPTDVFFGNSAEETAKMVGTGRGKVEKIRTLLAGAPSDIMDAVNNGSMTVNAAYEKIMESRRIKKPVDENRKINKLIRSIERRFSREEIVKVIRRLEEKI